MFRISDDGCGMDEAQLRALRESIRDTNSVSIGLRNVCRRILLNYGEKYQTEIESKKDVGSTVTLYLPYQLTAEPTEAEGKEQIDTEEEESNGS